MQFKKPNFQIGTLIYLILNILFILPIILFDKHIGDSISFFGFYLIMVVSYYVFLFTYIHILFCIGFLIYNIKKFAAHKKIALFVVSLIIIIIDIFVNIYWAACGRPWSIQ